MIIVLCDVCVIDRWVTCALAVQVHVSYAFQTADYRSLAAALQAGAN